MNKENPHGYTRSTPTLAAVVLLLTILALHYHDALWAFFNFVRDRGAVAAYLDHLGLIGPPVLMGLIALQVLITWLPGEPMMIAGAYAYGFVGGFLINLLVTVAVSQTVFYLARYAGRPVIERFIRPDLLQKWTRVADGQGMSFFLLAFLLPPIPSDLMNYVAGLGGITGRRFFVASLIGRVPMIAFFSLVGSRGVNIAPTTIMAWIN